MEWVNTSEEKPGFTVYTAEDTDNPGHTYVIQRKNGLDSAGWRLAFRPQPDEALRIILVAGSRAECEQYAEQYKTEQAGAE